MSNAKNSGRPKGAKTKDRAHVVVKKHETKCPECGSRKKPVDNRTLREGAANGIVPVSGEQYNYYRHISANCPDCKRALLVREYTVIPPEELAEREAAAREAEMDVQRRELEQERDKAQKQLDLLAS